MGLTTRQCSPSVEKRGNGKGKREREEKGNKREKIKQGDQQIVSSRMGANACKQRGRFTYLIFCCLRTGAQIFRARPFTDGVIFEISFALHVAHSIPLLVAHV